MKTLTKETFNLPVTRTATLESAQVVDDLYVYKLTVAYSFDAELATLEALASLRAYTEQGLAKIADIEAFAHNKVASIQQASVCPAGLSEEVPLQVVSPNFVRDCALVGFSDAWDGNNSVTADVFDAFVDGQWGPEQVAAPYYAGHMLYDRLGEVLPTALYFDYLSGRVVESVYNLEKLVEHLSADPRVVACEPRHKRSYEKDSQDGLYIQDVPYYNRHQGQSKFVEFLFRPTAEDMQTLWRHAYQTKQEYPTTEMHRCIFELDLLGLKAAGAALCPDSYYSDVSDADRDTDNE